MNVALDDRTPIRLIGLGAAAMDCEVDYDASTGALRFVYVGNPHQDAREGQLTAANLRPEAQPIPRGPFAEAVRKAHQCGDDHWETWLPGGAHWLDTYLTQHHAARGPEEGEMYAASRRLTTGGHVLAVTLESAR